MVETRGTAWAVGWSSEGKSSLVLRWTGTAWQRVASPNPEPADNSLNAVSASSTGDAWAVGDGMNASNGVWKTVIEHWNGASWH